MANIKTTPEQWDKAREYFEAGLLLREISEKTKIPIPNISKKAKANGWQKQTQKQTLIATAVQVEEAKAKLSKVALGVHTELVDERVAHIKFFNDAAFLNVEAAVNKITPETSQAEHKMLADTILKGRETVLGKTPDIALQVNTGMSAQSLEDCSDEDLQRLIASGN